MENIENKSYTFSFVTASSKENIFETLLDVRNWWMGLYGEDIKGSSTKLNDEFTFNAGEGVHYSKQKLVEIIANKKIVWLVTESNLSFAKKDQSLKSCLFAENSRIGASEISFNC